VLLPVSAAAGGGNAGARQTARAIGAGHRVVSVSSVEREVSMACPRIVGGTLELDNREFIVALLDDLGACLEVPRLHVDAIDINLQIARALLLVPRHDAHAKRIHLRRAADRGRIHWQESHEGHRTHRCA